MKYLKSHSLIILLIISIILNVYLLMPFDLFYNDGLTSSIVGTYQSEITTYDTINASYTLAIDQEDIATLYSGETILVEGPFIKQNDHYLLQTGFNKYIFQFTGEYIYFGYTFNENSNPISATITFKKVGNIPSYQVAN